MRAHLNERSSAELLEIMEFWGFTNITHTLNVLIRQQHQNLIHTQTHVNEVFNNNDQGSTNHQQQGRN